MDPMACTYLQPLKTAGQDICEWLGIIRWVITRGKGLHLEAAQICRLTWSPISHLLQYRQQDCGSDDK